jgi:hypothetical protein
VSLSNHGRQPLPGHCEARRDLPNLYSYNWWALMADIFISYSRKHAQLTVDLARDLEAEGYTTWWDTSLLPDDVFFPETIRAEIAAAKAVIVIWAEHSITSRWVYSDANEGFKQGKLLQVRDPALGPSKVPVPFNSGNIPPCSSRRLLGPHSCR